MRIAQPPAEPLGARDATGAAADMAMPPRAEPLGPAMLEQPSVQELEKRIRSINTAYEGLSVSTDGIRKSQRCYVLNVHGPGDRFCLNKCAMHRNSGIYFVANRHGVSQKCWAGKRAGSGCENFRSAASPITPALRDILFSSGPAADASAISTAI